VKPYQVAIPSHRRAATLAATTLKTLADGGVPADLVTVFVDEDDPDYRDYVAMSVGLGYAVQVMPPAGINGARRFIADHYRTGTAVVCMDDDVTGVFKATNPKTLQRVTDLDRFIRYAFMTTLESRLAVWGVSAVANPYFMRPGSAPSTDLKFIIATLWGFISRPGHPVHQTSVPVKEDYETSLRAWWYDGGVVRFNNITVKADHYKTPGGCQDYRTADLSRAAADQLIREWPGIVRLNYTRKSGHAEILLNRRARHAGHDAQVEPPGICRPNA